MRVSEAISTGSNGTETVNCYVSRDSGEEKSGWLNQSFRGRFGSASHRNGNSDVGDREGSVNKSAPCRRRVTSHSRSRARSGDQWDNRKPVSPRAPPRAPPLKQPKMIPPPPDKHKNHLLFAENLALNMMWIKLKDFFRTFRITYADVILVNKSNASCGVLEFMTKQDAVLACCRRSTAAMNNSARFCVPQPPPPSSAKALVGDTDSDDPGLPDFDDEVPADDKSEMEEERLDDALFPAAIS